MNYRVRKMKYLISSIIFSIFFAGYINAQSLSYSTAIGNDLTAKELKAFTVEGWDGPTIPGNPRMLPANPGEKPNDQSKPPLWEIYTNLEKVPPMLQDDKSPNPKPVYEPKKQIPRFYREVKVIEGNPRDLKRVEYKKPDERKNYSIFAMKFQFTYPGYNAVFVRPPREERYRVLRYKSYITDNDLKREDYKEVQEKRTLEAGSREVIYGIELPGHIKALSVWVLGRGDDYTMEGWFNDYKGNDHVLKFGSLKFVGWRPLTVEIPTHIAQGGNAYPLRNSLVFTQFVIRSTPKTGGDMAYFFMDDIQILSDVFGVHFDGATTDFDFDDCREKQKLEYLLSRKYGYEDFPVRDCSTPDDKSGKNTNSAAPAKSGGAAAAPATAPKQPAAPATPAVKPQAPPPPPPAAAKAAAPAPPAQPAAKSPAPPAPPVKK